MCMMEITSPPRSQLPLFKISALDKTASKVLANTGNLCQMPSLSFFICKIGLIIESTSYGCCED